MRILLIRPFLNIFNDLSKIGGTYQPLNLMYLCALLKKEGHFVAIIDYEVEPKKIKEIYKDLQRGQYDVIGITSMTPSYPNACFIARLIKKRMPWISIIFGGTHTSILPEEVLFENPAVDYVIRGEGEITVLELLKVLESKDLSKLSLIQGLSFRTNSTIIHNPERTIIADLDTLPFPDRMSVKKENYKGPLSPGLYRNNKNRYAEVYTSRGCPYQCKFCSIRLVMGSRCRWRSIDNIMKEIDDLVQNQCYNYIFFHDDNFALDRTRILTLCAELKKRKILWSCLSRVDHVDEYLLRKMREAGCDKIAFGVESGSRRLLNAIKKNTTPMQIVEAFRLAKKYHIKTQAYLMVGHPSETKEDIKKSISLMKRINPDFLFVSVFTPYPGTSYYEEAIKKHYIQNGNWQNFLFFTYKPVSRSDNFTIIELYKWQRKILTAFYFRISYLLQKILSFRSFYDIWYYLNATISFMKFILKPFGQEVKLRK